MYLTILLVCGGVVVEVRCSMYNEMINMSFHDFKGMMHDAFIFSRMLNNKRFLLKSS